MKIKKLLGLDVGDRRIGIAMSDSLGWTAQPIKTLHRNGTDEDFLEIIRILKENHIEELVVGLPKNMNGTIGEQGEKVQNFVEKLKDFFDAPIPVWYWDERLSSRSAERILIEGNVSRKKRKNVIDKMAAVIILQNYMDGQSIQLTHK